jgi:hypothetical protein
MCGYYKELYSGISLVALIMPSLKHVTGMLKTHGRCIINLAHTLVHTVFNINYRTVHVRSTFCINKSINFACN